MQSSQTARKFLRLHHDTEFGSARFKSIIFPSEILTENCITSQLQKSMFSQQGRTPQECVKKKNTLG